MAQGVGCGPLDQAGVEMVPSLRSGVGVKPPLLLGLLAAPNKGKLGTSAEKFDWARALSQVLGAWACSVLATLLVGMPFVHVTVDWPVY